MSRAQSKEIDEKMNGPVSEPAKKDATFPVKELLDNSQELFGYYPEVLEAALVGKREEALTISDARNYIEVFLKKEVK